MLKEIAYFSILGQPFIFYLGIITFICLLFTAAISILNKKGITAIPFKWHPIMAKITIVLAIIHGFFAIAARF